MDIDAIAAIVAAVSAATGLIGSRGIRAVVSSIFRRPKQDSVVIHRPDGEVEVIDVAALPKMGRKGSNRWPEDDTL